MRTSVRVRRGDHPARRRRLVLRLRRAAGRSAPAGPPRDRRLVGRAGGELRGQGVRHPHGHERLAGPPPVPAGGGRRAALRGLHGGEPRHVPRLRRYDAPGRGAVHRRGVPGRARDGAGVRDAAGDRRAAAAECALAGWAARDGRRGEDEVPRQGGERGGQAGRAARGAAGWRARVSASVAGGAAVGCGAGDVSQAPRAGDRHGRAGGGALRGGAGVAARGWIRPSSVCARAQP